MLSEWIIKVPTNKEILIKPQLQDDLQWEHGHGWSILSGSCGHSHGSGLRENISVDVHHQIASGCILHNKTHMLLCLETRKQIDQERVADAVDGFKNPFLAHQTEHKKESEGNIYL